MRSRILRVLAASSIVMAVGVTSIPAAGAATVTAPSAATQAAAVATNQAAAIDFESDRAVAGTPPSQLPCAPSIIGANACFDKAGDKIWLKDTAADGASAVFRWRAIRDGERYRYGQCINTLGNGRWGVCNKNFVEGVKIYGYVCTWDQDVEQEPATCGNESSLGTA
jgi:hypothetical protein